MVRRTTRIGTGLGGLVRALARCGFGRSIAWVGGVALSCALISADPASAQIADICSTGNCTGSSQVLIGGTAVTSTSPVTLSGTVDGNNGQGYFVAKGGTLTADGATLQNFTTSGGSGSGGGLGAGGAIFIDNGGTVILNNTNFTHNTAIGGIGGTSSSYGGTLNGITSIPGAPNTPNGANGADGQVKIDDQVAFGDGKGNGASGFGVGNGGNATNGFGGNGGVGGAAGNGWAFDYVDTTNVLTASLKVSADGGKVIVDTANVIGWFAAGSGDVATCANPFLNPLCSLVGSFNFSKAVVAEIGFGLDSIALEADATTLALNVQKLNVWKTLVSEGLAGNGGSGEAGGNGGKGSTGFGGGGGGQGGAYGTTPVNNGVTKDGTGGSGGTGGNGGFGGGGGAGGYGFGANQNGCGSSPTNNGCTSSSGSGGSGGTGGFGGGVGSKGGVTGVSNATGGGGGDAYGGAIFINTGGKLIITGNSTFDGNGTIGGGSLNGGVAGGTAGSDIMMMQGSMLLLQPGVSAGNIPNVITFNGSIADNSVSSIGPPTTSDVAGYPNGGGASLTIGAGITALNGQNTYSGQTVINGGDVINGVLNTGANTPGAPNYGITDGALRANDGVGLPTTSNLNFQGPNRFTGGVLEITGITLTGGIVAPTVFNRFISTNPNPNGGGNPGGLQWTGSGGFAALNAPLTVSLSGNAPLTWGQNGFVPVGYSLIFGSADSNASVTFANNINIGTGTDAAGTSASILVGNNGNAQGSLAIMAGVLSGSGDLSIGGGGFNGILDLTANNTYTGGTYVHSGTLMLSGNGSIASSSGLFLDPGAAIDVSGCTTAVNSTTCSSNAVIPSLNGSGNVVLGNQELEVKNGGTFSGSLVDGATGHGSLIVDASATPLTLSGTNTYTGDTTINIGGTLILTGNGSISNSNPVIDNGTFDITQLPGMAAIQGLRGSGSALIGSNMLVITNGTSTTAPSTWFSGVISGNGGSLAVIGGTQTLSGTNTYTSSTIIAPNAGATATLALAGSGSIAASNAVLIGLGGTFDISQTTTGASIQTMLGSGNVALGSKTLTVSNASTRFDGVIGDGGIGGGTGGNLRISGTGPGGINTLTLSGTNTYTGTTTIDPNGTLALIGGGSIAQSSNVIVNGIFDISQSAGNPSIKTLSGNSGGLVSLGKNALFITNGSTTFAGDINDGGIAGGHGGALAIGGGTQTLTGINSYTGVTQINPLVSGGTATLALAVTGSIATSSEVLIGAGGTFDISQTTAGATIQTLAGIGNVALGNQRLTIKNASTTYGGVISDGGIATGTAPGSLTISGGTQTLTGVNTYTGDTTIAPDNTGLNPHTTATLALAGPGSIATSSKVAIATGGTFDISQTGGTSIKSLADTAPGATGTVALGAQTLTITGGFTTFSGVIADGGIGNGTVGNLVVSGGTQTLGGVNTYSGVTAVMPNPVGGSAKLALIGNGSIATSSELFVGTNGTFDISGVNNPGTSITTLSGLGSVLLGNEILTITAGGAGLDGTNPAGVFAGIISGGTNGGLAITGGHQELLGVNTYQGGTTVTNGAIVSINNSASLGAANSTLTLNNGMLVVDGSITVPQPMTLLGAPPGTDVINLNTNNVTFSGAINGPGVLTVINGGSINLTGTVSGLGGIILGPGTTLTASPGANSGIGTTPIILVPGNGAAPTNLFTGTVHVVGALDVVNGTVPELIILPGDSLVGVGSVNAKIVIQGTKAPGDGPGTIFVNGTVVNTASSNYFVPIDGPLNSATNCSNPVGCSGQYSSTVVTGSNTYTAGGTITPYLRGIDPPANNNYVAPVGSSYTVVYAPGGVLGSFAALTQPGVGQGLVKGTRFDALYFNYDAVGTGAAISATSYAQNAQGNPTAVNLWVTPSSYQDLSPWNIALAKNQSQVAYALDALRGVNDLNPAASLPAGLKNNAMATWDFGHLFPLQPQSLPGTFNTLSGEVAADAKIAAFEMTNHFLNLMLDPSIDGRHGGTAPLAFAADAQDPAASIAAFAYAGVNKATVPAATFDQRWSAWGGAFGRGVNASGDPALGSSGITAHIYGGEGGLDYRVTPETVVGIAFGGGGTNWSTTAGIGTGRSDAFEAGAYGTTHFGPAYLATAISASNHWMNIDRNAFGSDHLQSSFNAQSYGARVEAGYRYAMPVVAVTPYLAGVAQRFATPTYSETDLIGGGFGLRYASGSASEYRGEAGARLDSRFLVMDNTVLVLRGGGAYAYQMVTNPALVATFQAALAAGALPGAAVGFAVDGAVIPRNLGIATAGAELKFANNWSVKADFHGEFGSGSQSYGGTGTVRYGW